MRNTFILLQWLYNEKQLIWSDFNYNDMHLYVVNNFNNWNLRHINPYTFPKTCIGDPIKTKILNIQLRRNYVEKSTTWIFFSVSIWVRKRH